MDERILNHEGEFAFKELTEVLGRDFQGQSFISEGFIFNPLHQRVDEDTAQLQ